MHILHPEPDDALDLDLLEHAQRVVRARVRELRARAGITQDEAAARLGRGQWYWSRIESGGVELRVGHLLEVQVALGLDTIEGLLGPLPSQKVARGETPS